MTGERLLRMAHVVLTHCNRWHLKVSDVQVEIINDTRIIVTTTAWKDQAQLGKNPQGLGPTIIYV